MRQILLQRFGGPEVLEVSDQPDPTPPLDGYVVEVRAAGINYADVVERRGRYARDQQLPFALGKEAPGVIVDRGADAREFEVGARVIVIEMQTNGCYAERVAVPGHHVLPAREGLSFEELAAYPVAYATAWYALAETARVRPGDSVLIQAAGGGVGIAAVRLAQALGCGPIYGTAGSDEKCAWVESEGAERCFNYRQSDFAAELRELTDGRGVDCVLDSVGGEVFEKSLELLADLGRIVILGFASIPADFGDRIERLHPLKLFHRSVSVGGLNVARLDFPQRRAVWDRMEAVLERHRLGMKPSATFSLEQAREAHEALEQRRTQGKLVLLP